MLRTKYPLMLFICCGFGVLPACGSKDFKRNDPEAKRLPVNSSSLQDAIPEESDSGSIEEVQLNDEQLKASIILKKDPPACSEKFLDFDRTASGRDIYAGEKIKEQYSAWGVTIDAVNRRKKIDHVAITFDSGNPTGNDEDLATPGNGDGNTMPLGMLLIIPETLDDNDNDGLVDDPNDSAKGGELIFYFAQPTELRSIDMIDIEEKDSYIELYDAADNVTQTEVPAIGDNSVQTISWSDKPKLNKLKVTLDGSGAIDNLRICIPSTGKGK
ncbi:MAG: hypothetical protein ACOH5I_18810 [Oligoflexus sp.]